MGIGDVPQAEHFRILVEPAPVLDAYVQHRERLAATVQSLDAAALATPSRCSLWSVGDVLRHGCDVDEVMVDMWSGRVSKWAKGFDPITTPHEGVLAQRDVDDAEVRDRYLASTAALLATVRDIGPARWGDPSFSPVGPVPLWLSVLHAFFDSWLHGRDALVPLGDAPAPDPTETSIVLTYTLGVVALTRFFEVQEGFGAIAAGAWVTLEPVPVVTAGVADPPDGLPVVTGDPAAITDALGGRGAMEDVAAGDEHMLHALGAFDRFQNPANSAKAG